MTLTDRSRLRADFVAAIHDAGLTLSFHGPGPAPSIPRRGCGYLAWRTWSNDYVVVRPDRPMTGEEWCAYLEVRRRWDSGHGHTIMAGERDSWPVQP